MSESLLDKLSDDNWKDLARDVAHLIYPVKTLVEYFDNSRSKAFGVVSSISKLGKITIKCGKLPVVEVTDNKSPSQATFWYEPDINKLTKGSALGDVSLRFAPTYYYPNWKEEGYESPIKWIRETNHGLSKVKIEENGLTKDIIYFR